MVQDDDGGLYQDTLTSTVRLVSLLCDRLSIPRRVPVDAHGEPLRGVVSACQ